MRFLVALIMLMAGFASFFVNFNIVFDRLVVCQSNNPSLSGLETVLYIAGISVAVLVCWLLSSFDSNMMTINFCGTRLYGHMTLPQGYVSTKWLVMFGLPVVPVQSYEVIAEQYAGMGKAYALNPREDLEWGQVVRTAITGYGILFAIELSIVAFLNWVICF